MEIRKISIALSDQEIDIVQKESALTGSVSFSATVRKIIREWANLNTPSIPLRPIQVNDHEES